MSKTISAPKAIAFDAYGTLCYVGSPRNPYHQLLNSKSISTNVLRRELMTNRASLEEIVSQYGIDQPEMIAKVESLVAQEVESVQPFPEVVDTLQALKQRGFCLAVVSNLAPPYAVPIKRHFLSLVDHFVFSFEVGAIKPEPKIFQVLCEKLETAPSEVLMVGDSMKSDIQSAKQFGMKAIQIDRKLAESESDKNPNSLSNIGKVLELVNEKARW